MNKLRRLFFTIIVMMLTVTIPVAGLPAEVITYFHNDISGTPIMATDSAGNVLWKENYKPYGDKLNNQAANGTNNIGFHGSPFDNATALSYMGARYYDPLLGRFAGIDPVDFSYENIHSFNRYTYANNNPYKYIDPDGHWAFIPWIGVAIAALKVALSQGIKHGIKNEVQDQAENVAKGAAGGGRAGKSHTPAANRLGREQNRAENDGELICPACGKKMNEPVQNKKGVPVDRDAAVGDHVYPKSQGGDGATVKDMRNHQTKCWQCNADKRDSLPE